MKINPTKIFFLFILVTLGIIIVISLITTKQQKALVSSINNAQKKETGDAKIQSDRFKIARQSNLSYNFLQNNPDIANAIKKIIPNFQIDDIATSSPIATAELSDGKELLLLWGCATNNCGGTVIVTAYNQENKSAYILREDSSVSNGYNIIGSTSQEINDLLVYYYENN